MEDLIGVEARPALKTALECFVGEGGGNSNGSGGVPGVVDGGEEQVPEDV